MLPLTDTVRPRRLPVVTLTLIGVNVVVWLGYQLLAGIETSIENGGTYACSLNGSCDAPLPWAVSWLTAMFLHGGWAHLTGNMLFLAVFGPRVEDDLGRLRFLVLYLAAGLGASVLFDATTLAMLRPEDAAIPSIGASGAISGVVGAYVVAHPFQRVVTWTMPAFLFRIPALGLLGVWFVLQVVLSAAILGWGAEGVGIAFAAHVGGFLVGAGTALVRAHGFGTPRAAA